MIEDVGVNEMRRDEVGWNNSQVGLRLEKFWTDNNGEDYPPTKSALTTPLRPVGEADELAPGG
jgi:hypothetical protein